MKMEDRTLDLSFLTWLFVMETVIGILWRDQGQVWWITDTSVPDLSPLLSPIAQMIISFLNKTFSIRLDAGIEVTARYIPEYLSI